ncbi:MAG: hypothetical protein AAGA90_00805 [Actinomycetota bacterium]
MVSIRDQPSFAVVGEGSDPGKFGIQPNPVVVDYSITNLVTDRPYPAEGAGDVNLVLLWPEGDAICDSLSTLEMDPGGDFCYVAFFIADVANGRDVWTIGSIADTFQTSVTAADNRVRTNVGTETEAAALADQLASAPVVALALQTPDAHGFDSGMCSGIRGLNNGKFSFFIVKGNVAC